MIRVDILSMLEENCVDMFLEHDCGGNITGRSFPGPTPAENTLEPHVLATQRRNKHQAIPFKNPL